MDKILYCVITPKNSKGVIMLQHTTNNTLLLTMKNQNKKRGLY